MSYVMIILITWLVSYAFSPIRRSLSVLLYIDSFWGMYIDCVL